MPSPAAENPWGDLPPVKELAKEFLSPLFSASAFISAAIRVIITRTLNMLVFNHLVLRLLNICFIYGDVIESKHVSSNHN